MNSRISDADDDYEWDEYDDEPSGDPDQEHIDADNRERGRDIRQEQQRGYS